MAGQKPVDIECELKKQLSFFLYFSFSFLFLSFLNPVASVDCVVVAFFS